MGCDQSRLPQFLHSEYVYINTWQSLCDDDLRELKYPGYLLGSTPNAFRWPRVLLGEETQPVEL